MLIDNKTFDLQAISLQVLAACPAQESTGFKTGYISFVECFFIELDLCAQAISPDEGKIEIDLSLSLQLTIKKLETIATQIPQEHRHIQHTGMLAGALATERMLILAFDPTLRFEVA